MNKKEDYLKYISSINFTISFTAFLAAGLLAVISKDTVDTPLIVFSCMSAIAIPTLFVYILVDFSYAEVGKLVPGLADAMFLVATMVIGWGSGFFAVVALFWHLSSTAAILFTVTVPLLFLGTYRFFVIPYSRVTTQDSDSKESIAVNEQNNV